VLNSVLALIDTDSDQNHFKRGTLHTILNAFCCERWENKAVHIEKDDVCWHHEPLKQVKQFRGKNKILCSLMNPGWIQALLCKWYGKMTSFSDRLSRHNCTEFKNSTGDSSCFMIAHASNENGFGQNIKLLFVFFIDYMLIDLCCICVT
jgi:hypothetical protein